MKKGIALMALAALVLAVVAIGGATALAKKRRHVSSESVQADPNGALKFNTRTLHAGSGVVAITMVNPQTSDTDHAIAIAGKDISTRNGKIVHPGKSSKVEATLKPGTYTFYCPVPGHEAAGMKGKLIVQ